MPGHGEEVIHTVAEKKKRQKYLTLECTQSMSDAIKKLAKREDRSASQTVRLALRDHLAHNGFKNVEV